MEKQLASLRHLFPAEKPSPTPAPTEIWSGTLKDSFQVWSGRMAAINQMTDLEKVQAMEQLWQSLTVNNCMPEPPEWHGRVLAERAQAVEESKTQYTSLAALKERGPRR
ncbi:MULTISPECIES: addiction module protein [Marinobacter]|nr:MULTISPECIES: addiction module protein [Marinobacter]MCD1628908.1 addiction module protein [Marinobacter shengliensis]